jgi:fluoroacetyl-CoA thioesterase
VGDLPGSCVPGRRATVTLRVGEEDTAAALGSGDVAVLGTPRVLAIAEQASRKALGDSLGPEHTTVGAWAEVEHVAPSWVGDQVEANAVLLGVDGHRLEFSVTVTSGGEEVAHIRHRRVVVDRNRFLGPQAPARVSRDATFSTGAGRRRTPPDQGRIPSP